MQAKGNPSRKKVAQIAELHKPITRSQAPAKQGGKCADCPPGNRKYGTDTCTSCAAPLCAEHKESSPILCQKCTNDTEPRPKPEPKPNPKPKPKAKPKFKLKQKPKPEPKSKPKLKPKPKPSLSLSRSLSRSRSLTRSLSRSRSLSLGEA
uniref:Uncharacterized protein n=1 Tax=Ditylenchus dipsaci TaxID=166011 RepID=A0A915CSN6_9BILA